MAIFSTSQNKNPCYRLEKFFSGVMLGNCTADTERSSLTYFTSVDAVSARDVPFGGLIDTSHPMGSYRQKPLILGTSMGIASLNVYGRISAQKKRIITLDGSKSASRQDTQYALVNGVISGVIFTLYSRTTIESTHPVELLLN
jgi:hypothetical protein